MGLGAAAAGSPAGLAAGATRDSSTSTASALVSHRLWGGQRKPCRMSGPSPAQEHGHACFPNPICLAPPSLCAPVRLPDGAHAIMHAATGTIGGASPARQRGSFSWLLVVFVLVVVLLPFIRVAHGARQLGWPRGGHLRVERWPALWGPRGRAGAGRDRVAVERRAGSPRTDGIAHLGRRNIFLLVDCVFGCGCGLCRSPPGARK